jgi:thiamine-phosphate pyrophosphorylase
MTDERLGDRLWEAVDRLPAGAGIVFRHYDLSFAQRMKLGEALASRANARNLLLAVAGSVDLADMLGAALIHNPDRSGKLPVSLAVHDEQEARIARKVGTALAFVAPIYPTRSHAGVVALGADLASQLAGMAGCPAIALGGMNAERFAELGATHPDIFHGYAGIDCWLRT